MVMALPGRTRIARDHRLGRRSPPGWNDHPLVALRVWGWEAWVDEGVADDVAALWRAGIWTWVSCQGSAKQARYVGLTTDDRAVADAAMAILGWPGAIIEDVYGWLSIYGAKA